eukprot:TRINITY_DN44506_c0_g1_i2.p1 TRINITY_DN44506_c0_g1~~TRINITY_DN44506_c0_g1_i2.p1  ORF type:complete len:111 (+),score=20.10 TRINITY_DN44506_c0_g1_i2:136-468(+)
MCIRDRLHYVKGTWVQSKTVRGVTCDPVSEQVQIDVESGTAHGLREVVDCPGVSWHVARSMQSNWDENQFLVATGGSAGVFLVQSHSQRHTALAIGNLSLIHISEPTRPY